jgi:hypothetical protein
MGLGIVIFWVAFSWLWWAFKRWGIPALDWDNLKITNPGVFHYIGDLRMPENVIYWEFFIKDHFIKFCLGFIVVMVYLFW